MANLETFPNAKRVAVGDRVDPGMFICQNVTQVRVKRTQMDRQAAYFGGSPERIAYHNVVLDQHHPEDKWFFGCVDFPSTIDGTTMGETIWFVNCGLPSNGLTRVSESTIVMPHMRLVARGPPGVSVRFFQIDTQWNRVLMQMSGGDTHLVGNDGVTNGGGNVIQFVGEVDPRVTLWWRRN